MSGHKFTDEADQCIETGKQLGLAGGEGTVYAILSNPDMVAKIYHELPDALGIDKLEWMIKNPPVDVSTHGSRTALAWPQSVLFDSQKKVVGFTMPFVDAWDIGRIADKRQREKLFTASKRPFDWRDLHTIARNVAMIVNACHHAGYVIGDINYNNVRVRSDGTVVIIDNDSFQVLSAGGGSVKVHQCTKTFPGYTPPELYGKNLETTQRFSSSDLFSLAVLLFELLQDRAGPFQGTVPKSAKAGLEAIDAETAIKLHKFPYDSERLMSDYVPPKGVAIYGRLHPELRKLFQQTFAKGMARPGLRPKADSWVSALDTARGSILECRQGHLYSGHAGSVCLGRSADQSGVCGSTSLSKATQPVPISKVNILDGSIVGVTPPGLTKVGVPGSTHRRRVGAVPSGGSTREGYPSGSRVVVQPGTQRPQTQASAPTPVSKKPTALRYFLVFTVMILLILVARENFAELSDGAGKDTFVTPTVQRTKQPVNVAIAPTATQLATNPPNSLPTDADVLNKEPSPKETLSAEPTSGIGSASADTSNIVRTRRHADGSSRPLRIVTPDPESDKSNSVPIVPGGEGENFVMPNDASRIVYSWDDGEDWHISMFGMDSGTTLQLASGFSRDPLPIFSSDGSSLIFVEHPVGGGNTFIHIFDFASNQITGSYSLSAPILVDRVALTPSGAGLLLSVSEDSGPRVLQFSFAGEELRPFLPVSSMDMAMASTGNSAYVVIENLEPKIVLADVQGKASTYIAPELYCQQLPVFSPDGSNMAFLYGICEGRTRRIAVWDGTSIVTLSHPSLSQWDPSVSIAWSPSQFVLAVGGCEVENCLITFVSIHGDSTIDSMTQTVDGAAVQIGSIDWSMKTVDGDE